MGEDQFGLDPPLDQHENYLLDLDEDRLPLFDIPE